MNHKTIEISHFENIADVDEKIAPLILACWKLGIKTRLSCENNVPKSWVWIMFDSATDAEKFISIVAANRKHSIYERISQEYENGEGKDWKYDICMADESTELISNDNYETVESFYHAPPNLKMNISVRFPCSDLKYVMKMIDKKLKGK
mgnify:CR=1 FL=1